MRPYAPSFEVADSVARWAARRWAQRMPSANIRDLRQEAWVAIKLAERSYRPELGPFAPYARQACIRWLTGTVAREASPVSGSSHAIAWLVVTRKDEFVEEGHESAREDPEEEVHFAMWRAQVQTELREIFPERSDEEYAAIIRILTNESRAADEDLPTERLHGFVRRAKERLASSRELWQLWNER